MSYLQEENEILRKALEEAKKSIAEHQAVLQQLLLKPTVQGIVVSLRGSKVLISIPQGVMEVAFPREKVDNKDLSMLRVGNGVRCILEPKPAIVDILGLEDWTGDLAYCSKEGKNNEVEVDWQSNTRVVRYAPNIKLPEPGDRLMMDERVTVAIKNLGPDESKFSFLGITGVTWSDIGGLENAKAALIEAVELPQKYHDLYKQYNKKPIKGVLLYGPPGCGKTMLAKAVATSVAKQYGKQQVESGFIYIKGPELLNSFVGNTEAAIRALFTRARKHKKQYGYPSVILLDEADALLGKRGANANTGINHTVVPQFLSEMDGLDPSGAIMLLATNRPDSLDSAVTRDGRVDRKVRVNRPDFFGAEAIFKIYLKSCPLAEGVTVDMAATVATTALYDQKFKYYNLIGKSGSVPFTLSNLVNGAMIAGLVDKATTTAMLRDIQLGEIRRQALQEYAEQTHSWAEQNLTEAPSGVTLDDLLKAINMAYVENKDLNHEVEVQEFVESTGMSVDRILAAA